MAKAKTIIGFDDIARAIREIPEAALTQTRAAHREVWLEFRDKPDYPGLKMRFDTTGPASFRPGHFAQFTGSAARRGYQFSGRQRQIPRGAQMRRGGAGAAGQLRKKPAYVHSGAMRDELMNRRFNPKRHGNRITTLYSLHHRSINLWGGMRGIERIDWRRTPVTYLTTVYTGPGGSADRSGPEQRMVTRNALTPFVQRSKKTYREEWEWQDDELFWLAMRSQQILMSRMRNAIWTRGGKIKTKYQSRFSVAAQGGLAA